MHIISNYYKSPVGIRKYNFLKLDYMIILMNDNYIQFKYLNKKNLIYKMDPLYVAIRERSVKCIKKNRHYYRNLIKSNNDDKFYDSIIYYSRNLRDFIYYFNRFGLNYIKEYDRLYSLALEYNKISVAKFLYNQNTYSNFKQAYQFITTLKGLQFLYDKDSGKNIDLKYMFEMYDVEMICYVLQVKRTMFIKKNIAKKYIKIVVKRSLYQLFIDCDIFKKELQNPFVKYNAIWWSIYNNDINSFEYFDNLHFKLNQPTQNINLLKHLIKNRKEEILYHLKTKNYRDIIKIKNIGYYLNIEDIVYMIHMDIYEVLYHLNYFTFDIKKIIRTFCRDFIYCGNKDWFNNDWFDKLFYRLRYISDKTYFYCCKILVKYKQLKVLQHFIEKHIDKLEDNKEIKEYIIYLLKQNILKNVDSS